MSQPVTFNLQTHSETILPPELWALIISFLASYHRDADLLSLLTVSRQIHTLAEAALLKDVYLSVEYRHLGADDSRSPVIQFYQYCISISAPNSYRQRLVRSLLVEFAEGEPSSSEIQSLEQLIPTLSNLHSLVLKLARYRPSNHGHLRLLEEGIGIREVSLKKLEIVVNEAGPEGGPSISGLLNSQPAICDLTLSGRIQISDNDTDSILLPQLTSLNCFLYTSFRSLSSGDIVVPMSTFVLRATKVGLGGNSSVVTLTTMKSEGNDPVCFNVFLSMVPTLRSLEAYMKTPASKDIETLSPLCHTKVREIWYPAHVTWISHHFPSPDDDFSTIDTGPSSASRPSLQWVERALQPRLHGGSPRYLHWYGGRGDPDMVKWEGVDHVYEVWRADWESDLRSIF
ncbi:hypothetical protein ONZ45_g18616 [Pleurotus djamor]|nr:hypothetical protein ONZ45_g18616 [Pleurotus djamor]